MHIWVWVWVMLAVILVGAEILSPGWYYLPWAIGSALAAALEFAGAPVAWQWAAFVVVSSVVLVVAQRTWARK